MVSGSGGGGSGSSSSSGGDAVYHRFPLLQVAENGITSEGARFVSSLCQANRHVVGVNLSLNKIGQRGAFYLAEMLSATTAVRDLDVEGNDITNHGIRALFNALQHNRVLQTLSCGANGPLDLNSLNPGKWY